MTSKKYVKNPMVPTEWGRKVLRARLSLRRTQAEFGEYFRVSNITIYNWENGRTERVNKVHAEMMENLIAQLKQQGQYLPDEVFTTIYREQIERRGNALV